MGLDTSHDCWHGAYLAFMRWRNALELAAGIPQREFDGGHGYKWKAADIDWNSVTLAQLNGEWDKWPDDPLMILIVHQDCEGKIAAVHCGPLADRLEQLLPKLAEMGNGGGHIGAYVDETKQFIAGLRAAAEAQEDVEFH